MTVKQIVLSAFFFFAFTPLIAIELTTPDWEIVADGVSLCQPEKTSWGYVTVTDGRTLIGWTEGGQKRFQRKLQRKPSELLCADPSGFIWSISYDRQYLTQFNPDGILQWTKKLPARCAESASAKLIPGSDGRLFIPLENSIMCVDIHGNTKWQYVLNNEELVTLYEKSDGSLLCNGKISLSPFGELLSDTEHEAPEAFSSSDIKTSTCTFKTTTGTYSSITAFDAEGNELWKHDFRPEKVLFFEITDATIITLSDSWVIAGYTYNSSNISEPGLKCSSSVYEQAFGISPDEKGYISLVNGLKNIISINSQIAVNPSLRNVVYDLRYLNQAASSGYDFSSLLAEIIMNETDSVVLETAVNVAGTIGRDPDGLIFNAIETRLKHRTSFQFDDGMYAAFCNSIYAICERSGSYVRYLRALEILTPLVSTDYHTLVHEHASATIEKLIQLQTSRIQQ